MHIMGVISTQKWMMFDDIDRHEARQLRVTENMTSLPPRIEFSKLENKLACPPSAMSPLKVSYGLTWFSYV